jgi:hypothetical protein
MLFVVVGLFFGGVVFVVAFFGFVALFGLIALFVFGLFFFVLVVFRIFVFRLFFRDRKSSSSPITA